MKKLFTFLAIMAIGLIAFAQDSTAVKITTDSISVGCCGEYFKVKYRGNDTNIQWIYTAAGTSPTRPSCPSVIMTVKKISK